MLRTNTEVDHTIKHLRAADNACFLCTNARFYDYFIAPLSDLNFHLPCSWKLHLITFNWRLYEHLTGFLYDNLFKRT